MNGIESAAARLIPSHIHWCQIQDAPGSENGPARGPPYLAPGKRALEDLKTIPVMAVMASVCQPGIAMPSKYERYGRTTAPLQKYQTHGSDYKDWGVKPS